MTISAAGLLTGMLIMPDEPSDAVFFAEVLNISLLIWYSVAGASLLTLIQVVKTGVRAFLVRSLFFWGPISLGWYVTVQTGRPPWFIFGMLVSSIFFCYEIQVLRIRKKNQKSA